MEIAFQNTRGAVNAALRRLARYPVTIEYVADENDSFQRDGTFGPTGVYCLPYTATFSVGLLPAQIERLAAGGLTVTNGASASIAQALTRSAQRVYAQGAWWRVVEQSVNEGATVFTLDFIAAEPVAPEVQT